MNRSPSARPTPLPAFLAELKRRQVFRAAAVYGATAFAVLQAADLSFRRLGLPDWTVTFVLVLALVGFPFALLLAWAYESGPRGLRRTEAAEPGELAAIVAEPRWRRWTAGAAALAGVLLLGITGAWGFGLLGHRHARYESIAVLPFENFGGDPSNEYLGDGLAEELLSALGNIPGLKVAGRASAFALKGSRLSARAIGDTLGVAAVLEGSVRRSAGRVRVTVELIDARTGYDLWTRTYDRPATEMFALESAIASEIVDALAVRLAGGTARLTRGGTSDAAAYDAYLRGRHKWATRRLPDLRAAIDDFAVALARDSSFALAWSGLADAIDGLAWRDPSAQPLVSRAKDAAVRALVIEPELAEGWASLGILYCDFDRDWGPAETSLRRAVALKPSYAMAVGWLADVLRYSGRSGEAQELYGRALELDPLSVTTASGAAQNLLVLRRWPDARAAYDRLWRLGLSTAPIAEAANLGFNPQEATLLARSWAARALADTAGAGVFGQAVLVPALRDSARRLLARAQPREFKGADIAALQVAFGDTAAALETLERAAATADPSLLVLGSSPLFDALRSSPRFKTILDGYRLRRSAPPT